MNEISNKQLYIENMRHENDRLKTEVKKLQDQAEKYKF